jgi:hypothetical protein
MLDIIIRILAYFFQRSWSCMKCLIFYAVTMERCGEVTLNGPRELKPIVDECLSFGMKIKHSRHACKELRPRMSGYWDSGQELNLDACAKRCDAIHWWQRKVYQETHINLSLFCHLRAFTMNDPEGLRIHKSCSNSSQRVYLWGCGTAKFGGDRALCSWNILEGTPTMLEFWFHLGAKF